MPNEMNKKDITKNLKTLHEFDLESGSFKKEERKIVKDYQLRAIIYCRVSDISQVKHGHGLE